MAHNTSHPSTSGGNSQVDVAFLQHERWEFVPVSLMNGLLEAFISSRSRVQFLEAEKLISSLKEERQEEENEHLKMELQYANQRIRDLEDKQAEYMSFALVSEDGDIVSREDLWASRAYEE